MSQWQSYSDKFLTLTRREQYILLFTGLFLIVYLFFILSIEPNLNDNKKLQGQVNSLQLSNEQTLSSIVLYQQALAKDPNQVVNQQIDNVQAQLAKIDEQLLALTSDLINPVQMRMALIDLLNMQKGVSLISFEVTPPEALYATTEIENDSDVSTEQSAEQAPEQQSIGLYRHAITLTLQGKYKAIQSYLFQLEQLSWKFFWQGFEYKVVKYPQGQVKVTLYSLSTKREFIGV